MFYSVPLVADHKFCGKLNVFLQSSLLKLVSINDYFLVGLYSVLAVTCMLKDTLGDVHFEVIRVGNL